MRPYFSRHPERASILVLLAAVFLLSGLTFDSSQSQDVPTPALPPGFRGIEPPVEGSGGFTRGPAPATISTEHDLGLLHSDDFDGTDPNLTAWLLNGELSLVSVERGQALRIPTKNASIQFVVDAINDIVVSTRLKLNTRGAEIRLRESEAGFYAVRIFARGQVQLFRNNEILAEVSIPKIKRSKWRNVRVSVIDDMIRVTINKTEVIAVHDSDPLPAGKFTISKRGSSVDPLLVNDVDIWLPRIDIPWLRTAAEAAAFDAKMLQTRTVVNIADGDVSGLITALQIANTGACSNTSTVINLSPNGLYELEQAYFEPYNNTAFNGLPLIRCTVVINGNGATIRRNAIAKFRLMHVWLGGWLTLNDITLRDGNISSSGGALLVQGRADVNNSVITSNTLDQPQQGIFIAGGGILVSFGTLNITDSEVYGNANNSVAGRGGGISIAGGSLVISGSVIRDNFAASIGGGIEIAAPITMVTITNGTQILNNEAGLGGGGIGIETNFEESQFILNTGNSGITTRLSGNSAGQWGGAIYQPHPFGGSVPITDVVVSENISPDGGAIFASQPLSISASCIVGNSTPSVVRTSFPSGAVGTVLATNNWWGASDGPSGVGSGSGDAVGANVDYSNWLTTSPSFCPTVLHLDLDIDWDKLTPEQLSDPYSFAIGEEIPLLANVFGAGAENITDPVQIELTVPRGLKPTGMTISGEDPNALTSLIDLLINLLSIINPDWSDLLNDIVGIFVDEQAITFTYDIDQGVVIGQPFEITLEVVGEVDGQYIIEGSASIVPITANTVTVLSQSTSNTRSIGQETATVNLQVGSCTFTYIPAASFQSYQINQPDKLRVLDDMKLIAYDNNVAVGLRPLGGPTVNARRGGEVLGWDSGPFQVLARIEFPQIVMGVQDKQIWYLLNQSENGDYWTPVRYNGLDFSTSSDPCADAETPATLVFPYDRLAAANYAIQHSYDTALNHGTLQGSGRVTQRIQPFGPLPLPYAYFRYSGIGLQQLVTGSAVFISEALWMGGLPMTMGDADSCVAVEGSLTKGWRYCFSRPEGTPPSTNDPDGTPPDGDASNPFDTHEDLVGFWSRRFDPALDNSVLAPESKGRRVFIQGGASAISIRGQTTLTSDFNQMINLGQGKLIGSASDVSSRVHALLTSNPNNIQNNTLVAEVSMGDYVYITSNPSHGLLVVGWGEAMNCASAIFENGAGIEGGYRLWTVSDFGLTYENAQTRNIPNPVPWVVDFTSPPRDNGKADTQSSIPRPFYCTMYWEPAPGIIPGTDDFFTAHDWYFYTMPDHVTVSTSSGTLNQLYIDPNWQWAENQ